ncbi:MAG: serine hydrolase [Longimicrobiales bacterium]
MAPSTAVTRTLILSLIASGCTQATSAPRATTPAAPPSQSGAPIAPPAEATAALERALRDRIAREQAEVGVAFVDLETGRRVSINGDLVVHAASTMKVPVLLEALRRHDEGTLRLDERIGVTNEFRSIADSSTYSLSAEDDSDAALYERVGETATVRELLERMITRSSNLATNIMLERFPAADVRTTLARIDAEDMKVLRGVEDIPAFERGMNNTTTANAFARVLEALARCRLLTAESCETGIGILAKQEFDDMIPAGVPAGTRVANKTGWITRIQHDGAIVYPPGRAPYVLVALTRGFDDTDAGDRLGADLSRIVWQHVTSDAFALPSETGDAGVDSLIAAHESVLIPEVGYRRVPHEHYWRTIEPYLRGSVTQEEVGRSAEGRPLYLLRFGNGPRTVLLWSQMHGDESTATMALADVVRFLDGNDPRTQLWSDSLTILMIPMLNPDGAARFRRHNVYGIDINRDARRLSTPEARTLKSVHTRFQPDFGFNLHDQNPRTRVGMNERTAAIALLAPAADEPDTDRAVAERAKHLAATLRDAAEAIVPGHVTRYDDSYNPRAFGDLVQQWGTSTVLIESGGWYDDPEKQVLRRTNFVLLTRAFDAIATGSYLDTPVTRYTMLPENGRSLRDLVIRNATVMIPGLQPYRADIAVDVQDGPIMRDDGSVVEIGDLGGVLARDDFEAEGLFVHFMSEALDVRGGRNAVRPGAKAAFVVRAGPSVDSEVVAVFEDGRLVRVR